MKENEISTLLQEEEHIMNDIAEFYAHNKKKINKYCMPSYLRGMYSAQHNRSEVVMAGDPKCLIFDLVVLITGEDDKDSEETFMSKVAKSYDKAHGTRFNENNEKGMYKLKYQQ